MPGPSTPQARSCRSRIGDALVSEISIEAAPPGARLRAGEVRKDRSPRPHDPDKLAAVGFLYKVIARLASVVRRVALVGNAGDMQVGNQNEMKVLFPKV